MGGDRHPPRHQSQQRLTRRGCEELTRAEELCIGKRAACHSFPLAQIAEQRALHLRVDEKRVLCS
ncbi:hypothetical protein LINPERHAP1_LOCUS13080 [Linum perenne]